MFAGKKIIIGITGSIAAYKSAELVRLFIKLGADVKVVMTTHACEFITPLTLSTLSKNPVHLHMVSDTGNEWNNHVDLANWADLLLIAPATASILSKMANGACDNMLTAVYLSASCPVYVAPAMDLEMVRHPSTKQNIQKLESFGNKIIYPVKGELASGLHGEGRMEEPAEIIRKIESDVIRQLPLYKKKILVTAGPTYENIDPVRFIGNYSSGKMGYAIAEVLANKGAEVDLVSGPVTLSTIHPKIKIHRVVSAKDMYEHCLKIFPSVQGAVMAAAVADFTPSVKNAEKIKKSKALSTIPVQATSDILEKLGTLKKKNQFLVGFALETDEGIISAKEKLKKKNLNFIVLNSLTDKGAGFGTNTNKISIIDRNNKIATFGLKDKSEVAHDIVEKIITLF